MFMFSLVGDAREWYHSLPPASISSLREFHAAFSRHCERFYSSDFICHNCCEEYEDNDQDMDMPNEDHKQEGDALSELMELAKCLSAELEELEAEHECCLFEENAEDFPALEEDVLGSSTEDDDEDFMVVEALYSAPEVPVVTFD
jgi:hypothetical protein